MQVTFNYLSISHGQVDLDEYALRLLATGLYCLVPTLEVDQSQGDCQVKVLNLSICLIEVVQGRNPCPPAQSMPK